MRTWLTKISAVVVTVVLCVLMIRLLVSISQTETEWESVTSPWIDEVAAWSGRKKAAIGELEPTAQVQFWIGEVDRVLERHPDSASIHMGAAWVLDSCQAFPSIAWGRRSEAEVSKLRELCQPLSLSLAARATELEPDAPDWWRMRALLLFEQDTLPGSQITRPRVGDWREMLDECIAHDEENALYDYLATMVLWDQGAEYAFNNMPSGLMSASPLNITDEAQFASGTERFRRGQDRSCLANGEQGYTAIADFLSHCQLTKCEQSNAVAICLVTAKQLRIHSLWRMQQARLDAARRDGLQDEVLAVHRELMRLYDQVSADESPVLDWPSSYTDLFEESYRSICFHAEDNPGFVAEAYIQQAHAREVERRTAAKVHEIAWRQWIDECFPDGVPLYGSTLPVPLLMVGVPIKSLIPLVVAGALLISVSLFLTGARRESLRVGVGCQLIAWIIGYGGSFVLLGIVPAEVVSRNVQSRAMLVAFWGTVLVTAAVATWFVTLALRRRQFQFRLTTMFAVTTVVALLVVLWPLVDVALLRISEFSSEPLVQAKRWDVIDVSIRQFARSPYDKSLTWAAIQWIAHGGPYMGLFVSAGLEAMWLMWVTARRADMRLATYWTTNMRTRWSTLFRLVGRSALIVAACWLFVFLWFAPQSICQTEAEFQYVMRCVRDPLAEHTEIRAKQAAIWSSEFEMKRIREEVQAELGDEIPIAAEQ